MVFPIVAACIGGGVAIIRTPSPAVVSGVQHFAAGVVMAAVAGEVLPEVRDRASWWLIVVGFSAGVAVPLALRRFESGESKGSTALPIGLLVAVGVDLFVDGVLVGTGAAVSRDIAVVIVIALTVEVLFLGLAVAVELAGAVPKVTAAAVTAGLSLLLGVGAVLGALLLADADDAVLGVVLAFAAAALLWLVVEELLVEAHETPERPWMAAMFFLGFLALFLLEAA